jgi:hypothetical protein
VNDKEIGEIEARIAAFERAFRAVSVSTVNAMKATQALERELQLAILSDIRTAADDAIRELAETQPEASE